MSTPTTSIAKPSAYKIRRVKVRDIIIDRAADGGYQRPLDRGLVAAKVANFDWDALGIPPVSIRDGKVYAIDGQHSIAALMELGYGDRPIDVQAFNFTRSREAGVFGTRNTQKAVHPLYKFNARIVEGEHRAVAIVAILAKHGYRIDTAPGPANIACVNVLDKVYAGKFLIGGNGTAMHAHELDRTLAIIKAAWPAKPSATRGEIVEAVARMVSVYGDQLETDRVVRVLARYPGGPDGLIGDGRTIRGIYGGSLPVGVTTSLVNAYNRGLRKNQLADFR